MVSKALIAIAQIVLLQRPSDGIILRGNASFTQKATTTNSFAKVPLKFIVITKNDGQTGRVPKSRIESQISEMNKYFAGVDPKAWTKEMAVALDKQPNTFEKSEGFPYGTCPKKCEISLCYGGGIYKNDVDASGCFCGNDFCKTSSVQPLSGELADSGISFSLQSVEYIANTLWHDQCCCAHAGGLGYEDKQVEIVDQLVDKNTVRSVVTVIVCDMKTTNGMAMITGKSGDCAGGPFIMLTTNFLTHALTHEAGHYFGLYHTWNEDCPAESYGACKASDVCQSTKNLGDHIDDTPLHKKQGQCMQEADSCPNVAGKDPLDNIMSYGACEHERFTPGQVQKMKQTITEYYPSFLTTSTSQTGKDFPCNPEFTSGLPSGYAPPKSNVPVSTPTAHASVSGCNLEEGQCDTHDTSMCTCHDAKLCCQTPESHGCAGYDDGPKMCIPCSWKSWSGHTWTSDSCTS